MRIFLDLVRQDVLLMAGSEDHYVPRRQFTQQSRR